MPAIQVTGDYTVSMDTVISGDQPFLMLLIGGSNQPSVTNNGLFEAFTTGGWDSFSAIGTMNEWPFSNPTFTNTGFGVIDVELQTANLDAHAWAFWGGSWTPNVVNHGLITVTTNQIGSIADVTRPGTSFTNTGITALTARIASGFEFFSGGSLFNSGVVDIFGSAFADGAYFENHMGGATATFDNSGEFYVVEGSTPGVAVRLASGVASQITNSGQMIGDIFSEGTGVDTVSNTGEILGNIYLGDSNDNYSGAGEVYGYVFGEGGADTLMLGAGNDFVDGGAGDDRLDGGTGYNTAVYDDVSGGVTVSLALQGAAQATGGAGSDTLTNFQALYGSDFDDALTGDGGANFLSGGDGADQLVGGGGMDSLFGGLGNDALTGGDGRDVALFGDLRSSSGVIVDLGGGYALGEGSDTLVGIEDIGGSSFADSLTGDSGANILAGYGGDDSLTGGAGNDELFGGDGADNLYGGDDADSLSGGGGADVLRGDAGFGAAGADQLTGDGGDDLIYGDGGADLITGGAGDDTLDGGVGDDVLDGSEGADTASYLTATSAVNVSLAAEGGQVTGAGTDTLIRVESLTGSSFDDRLTGNANANTIQGHEGNDDISAGGGQDLVIAGAGNDTVEGGAGHDILDGSEGTDTASYASNASAVSVSLAAEGGQDTGGAGSDTLIRMESLTGSAFNDTLVGNGSANTIQGGGGADVILAAGGQDLVIAGTGADTVDGGAGDDIIDGSEGVDTASYATASSAVAVSLAVQGGQVTGWAGTDTLIRVENLTGSSFNDTLSGNTGNNTIIGGSGADTVDGGSGLAADILDGSDGADTASYASASSAVNVNLSYQGGQDTGGAGGDTLIRMENLTGSSFNDILTGNGSDNIIVGGVGVDYIDGGAGNDILDGSDGADTVSYASAASAVTVNLSLQGGQGTGGSGSDTLIRMENLAGSSFDDTLTGDANANIITGGLGNDTLDGGAGNDILDGSDGTDTVSYASAASGVTVNLGAQGGQVTGGSGTDTLVRLENLTGSGFADSLRGSSAANVLAGGAGADTFVFAALGDSTTAATDRIADFAAGDRISLSGIDADSTTGGDQAFHLDGTTGSAGDIGLSYDGGTNTTTLDLYIDNDATVDARIFLTGNHTGLTAADFVL